MIKVDSRFEEITRKYSPSAPATPSKGSSSTGAAPATITAESSRRRFEEIRAKYAVSTPKITQPDVKTEEPSFWQRIFSMGKGAAKSTGASAVNTGGMALGGMGELQDAAFDKEYENQIRQARNSLDYWTKMYREATTEAERTRAQQQIDRNQNFLQGVSDLKTFESRDLRKAESAAYQTADRMAESAAKDIDEAKEGLGSVGQFAVDVGVAGAQLLGDIGVAALTGGSALAPMALRSFGSSAQKARQEGASYGQQLAYGAGSAALSMGLEKLANLATPLSRAFGSGVADDVIRSLGGKLNNSAAGRVVLNALGEGAEEGIESLLQPALERVTYNKDARYTRETLTDALYDSLVGAALGGGMGGVGEVMDRRGSSAADSSRSDTSGEKASTVTPGELRGVQGATAAQERAKPYIGEMPHNAENPIIKSPSLTAKSYLADGESIETAYGNKYRKAVETNAEKRLGIGPGKAAYLVASNVTKNGETYYAKVTRESLGKLLYTEKNQRLPVERLALVDNLEQIFDSSVWASSEGDRKGRQQIEGFDTLRASFYVDGAPYYADIVVKVVRQSPDSESQNVVYFLEPEAIQAIKKVDTQSPTLERQARKILFGGNASTGVNVAQNGRIVKYAGGTNTVGAAEQEKPKRDTLATIMFGPETQNTAASEETTAVDTDPAHHTAAEQRVIEEYQASTDDSILSFLKKWRGLKNPDYKRKASVYVGNVTQRAVADLKQLVGVDASGFSHSLSGNALQHIERRHGVNGEADQTMADDNDIARVGYVLQNYDSVERLLNDDGTPKTSREHANADGSNAPVVRFAKKVNGTFYVVEAVPDAAAKTLRVVSMYMQKNSGGIDQELNMPPVGDQQLTSETTPGASASAYSGDTVSQNKQIVKGDQGTNTVGAAAQGFDPFTALQNEHGTLPSGENPVRPDDVPVSTDGTDRVSQTIVTVKGAKVTPDEFVPLLENKTMNGQFSYIPISNDATVQSVQKEIMNVGWEQALANWTTSARNGESGSYITAMGAMLYNQAVNAGDTKKALDILVDYQMAVRNSARGLQAARILKTLTPESQLYTVERSRENLQQELNKRYGEAKAPQLTVSEELYDRFRSAETQDARDEAMRDIYRSIGKQMPSRFVDKWNAWRYLAMLGNARTHIRNIVGNAAFTPVVGLKTGIATGIEAAVSRVSGGKLERTKAPITTELWRAAWNDYANAQDAIQSGRKYGDMENSNRYIEEGREIFRLKPLETARRKNAEALDAEDTWFSRPHYALALAQYCSANGIKAEDLRSGEVLAKARDYAIREAQKATFRDTNALSQALVDLGQYEGNNPIKKGISVLSQGLLPFRKTPANILARGLEYSPAGLIKAITWDIGELQKGKITGAEMIDRISAGLTGTGLVALGMWMGAQGLVRGSGDEDEEQAAFDDLTGHQDYSLELPNGTSITLDWLAPESVPFFMGVNLSRKSDEEGNPLTLSTLLEAARKITDPLLEMSCLQSLNDAFDAVGYVSDSGVEGFPAFVAAMATSYLTQAVPTLFGQLERISEDKRYTTYTGKGAQGSDYMTGDMQYTLGKMLQRVPGIDYSQIPYIDAWGREEETGDVMVRAVNNLFNPAYVSQVDVDTVERELQRLYDATGTGSVLPNRADKSFAVNKETRYLTAEEYVKYAKAKGQSSYRYVSQAVNSAAYRAMSDEGKAELLSSLYGYANYKAKQAVVPSYESDTYRKCAEAEAAGVSPVAYYAMRGEYDYDGNGNITQAEAQRYLDGQRDLTENQKADLWTIINSSWKKNPYA